MDDGNVITVDMKAAPTTARPRRFASPPDQHLQAGQRRLFAAERRAFLRRRGVQTSYRDWFGTSPLTHKLYMKVHYGLAWKTPTGTAQRRCLFGDGATYVPSAVSLDVAAHEGQPRLHRAELRADLPRAIRRNERSVSSDMAGEAAEFYMRGKNDFLIGYDIKKGSGALRYWTSAQPRRGDPSTTRRSSTTASTCTTPAACTTVRFYLLDPPGWDTRKAFEVFVDANRYY